MQLEDISELLFGDNSNYGSAQQQGAILIENNWKKQESLVQGIMQKSEQLMPLYDEMPGLIQKMAECGDNKACQRKVEAEIDQLKYKMEQIVFMICKEEKSVVEMSLVAESKKYNLISGAIKEAIPDYYAFTNPIIERIYSPTLNDYFNTFREYKTVLFLELNARSALVLQGYSEELNNMDCVEPEPPQPPEEISDPKLPQKGARECPLGENGIGGGIGVLSFELSCDHVKLSGGEGLLWSLKRDFNKHETTIWGGVGVKGEYGRGTLTAEATMGMEITIGQGDAIKDVAFTSSVKAGVGGLAEAEISGRFALEGGPSISADAKLTPPGITDLLGF